MRARPNRILGRENRTTAADCQQDMAQAAGPAAAREQLGQARASAQTGPVRRT
jgi:hypothetical protein